MTSRRITKKPPKFWTDREDGILAELYPDYSAIRKRIRGRTFKAIKGRAERLGIAKKRHTWTAREVALLTKLYSALPHKQLRIAFPHLSSMQLLAKAKHLNLPRRPWTFKVTGFPMIDNIRDRAAQLGWTMVELDAAVKSRKYFQKCAWRNQKHPALLRAVYLLGGEISLSWDN